MKRNPRIISLAEQIALGHEELSLNAMLTIVEDINFSAMRADYLPPANIADPSPLKSKQYGLEYVNKLWGFTTKEIMEMENEWLGSAHAEVGSSDRDGKDVPTDLIMPQILARLISLAYFIYKLDHEKLGAIEPTLASEIIRHPLKGLNDFLDNSIRKGGARMTLIEVDGKPVNLYNFYAQSGVHLGLYGKFLPYPTKSLPFIFSLLHRDAILNKAYSKSRK